MVKEYLGGIYYFLEKRKLESLREIERREAPQKPAVQAALAVFHAGKLCQRVDVGVLHPLGRRIGRGRSETFRCCCNIPECICNRYGGGFCDDEDNKIVLVTLGIFTIVQLVRNVQMLVPVYDYCMPCKECCPTTDNPCDLFKKMCFPVNEFFPPTEDGRGGCCEKK